MATSEKQDQKAHRIEQRTEEAGAALAAGFECGPAERVFLEDTFTDSLISCIPGIFYVLDRRGRLLRWNKVFERLTGMPPEQLRGTDGLEQVVEQDRTLVAANIQKTFELGRAEVEAHLKLKDGPRLFYLTGQRMDIGAESFLIGSGMDISARQLAEHALREATGTLEKTVEQRTAALVSANRALRESEGELQAIYEHAPVMMMLLDHECRIRKANRFIEATRGNSARSVIGSGPGAALRCLEALGSSMSCGFGPKCQECTILRTVGHTLATGQAYHQVEATVPVIVDGERQDATVLLSTSKLTIRQEPHVLVTLHDITARKRAELLLRRESGFISAVLDTARAAIVVLDAKGRIARFNKFCEQVSGYGAGEAVGKHVWDFLLLPADAEQVRDNWEFAMTTAEPLRGEHYWRRKEGNLRCLLWRSAIIRDDAGKLEFVVAIGHDVTESRQTEEAIRRRERELSDFFSQSPLGLLWVGLEGSILRINQAGLEMLGQTRDEVLGRAIGDFCTEPEVAEDVLARVARGETVHNCPGRIRQKQGTVRHILIDANAMWERHCLVHSRWFMRDITDRVELQREILTISEREQRRLGHDLHDDLCQQLAGIQFLSQSLATDLAATSPAHAALAREIAQTVQETMKQTRELARGLSPVGLRSDGLMAGLGQLAARTAKIFRVQCRFLCAAPVFVPDHTVAIHLYRIAQEAVGNAVKHGRAAEIEISLTATDYDVRLGIADNGIGMPRKLTNRKGMGLRIMQYRAGVLGGSLAIQHGPNGGTTVVCMVTDGLLPHELRSKK